MAEGDTVLPAMGMGAIPLQMAAKLPQGSIHYGSRVVAVESNRVKLATGDAVEAASVVVATEGAEAVRLLPELPQIAARKVMTLYFAIDGPAPILDPIILLNGSLEWPIHNACVPSVVCPTYAPSGRHLMSVAVLGDPERRDPPRLRRYHTCETCRSAPRERNEGGVRIADQAARAAAAVDAHPDDLEADLVGRSLIQGEVQCSRAGGR